jgi:2-dehydro-3-deoxyphosphogalactonate aldolase
LNDVEIVAILRGIRPEEASAIGRTIYAAGIRCIEVPLNSPSPLQSIATLAGELPRDCRVGAGTVLDATSVDAVVAAGGTLIVTPNANESVVRRALSRQAMIMPGVATATEAFSACGWGATHLKLFPAGTYGPAHVRALKAVLPRECFLYAVGGVAADSLEAWVEAGVAGFGIGSELYRAGDPAGLVGEKARRIVAAYTKAKLRFEGGEH